MPFKCMGESGKAFDHHGVGSFYQNIVPRNLNGATRIQLKLAAWTVFPGLEGSPDFEDSAATSLTSLPSLFNQHNEQQQYRFTGITYSSQDIVNRFEPILNM